MAHSVTLAEVYVWPGDIPFASVALDVRAGTPPGDADWTREGAPPGVSEVDDGLWHDDTYVLMSETLGDATHALLVFMLMRHLLQQRDHLFDDADETAIDCGWPAMDTALASESWEVGGAARSAIPRLGGEADEMFGEDYTNACNTSKKLLIATLARVADSRAADAALAERLRRSDLGISANTARGWLCIEHLDVETDDFARVNAVRVNHEPSVAVEQCDDWVIWRDAIVEQIERTGVG